MTTLKEKEIQYSEANLKLSENVIYSKDVKKAILKFKKILSDYETLTPSKFKTKYDILYYLIDELNQKDWLNYIYDEIFGDWER